MCRIMGMDIGNFLIRESAFDHGFAAPIQDQIGAAQHAVLGEQAQGDRPALQHGRNGVFIDSRFLRVFADIDGVG